MSFASLLPAPKYSREPSKDDLQELKSKQLIVQTLTQKNQEKHIENPLAGSSIAENLRFEDFIPIRQRNFNLEIPLPSQDEIDETYERTKKLIDKIKNISPGARTTSGINQAHSRDTQEIFVRSSGEGRSGRKLKVIEHSKDPLQPNVHKAMKVVAPPVDEPMTPIFHKTDSIETTKKLTKEARDKWKIPPAISSWKNPNGYTIGIDKRVAMDGRYSKSQMQGHDINERFVSLSMALEKADRKARQELKLKAEAKKQIAEEEHREKEDKLRRLAQKAREERSYRRKNKRNYNTIEDGDECQEEKEAVQRENIRKSKKEGLTKEMRRSKMSTADRLRELIHSQGREVSEKVILGTAKATNSPGVHHDSRLYTKGSNTLVSRSEERVYDTPLFSKLGSTSYRTNFNRIDENIQDNATLSAGQIKPIEFTTSERSEIHKDSGIQKNNDL